METKDRIIRILQGLWLAARIAIVAGVAVMAVFFAMLVIPGGRERLPESIQKSLATANIHNTYIDSGFEDWQSVALDGFEEFHIPSQWEVSQRGGNYMLLTDGGDLVAYGAAFGTAEDWHSNLVEFLDSFVSFYSWTLNQREDSGFYTLDGCGLSLLTVRSNGEESQTAQYYYLHLQKDNGPTLAFAFPAEAQELETLREIGQAMAYDYVY